MGASCDSGRGMTKTFLDKTVISFLQQRHGTVSAWVTGLLVIVLAYQLAQLTWSLFPVPAVGEDNVPAPVSPVAEEQRGTAKTINLSQLHLFGTAAPPVSKSRTRVVTEEAPDTRLRLILRGVIAATDTEMARAIIAEPGGEEKYYAVEDKLPGGAVLKEIAPDRVILETRAGRLETLRLPKESTPGRTTRTMARAPSSQPQQRRSSSRNRIVPRISAAELRSYRDKMLTNPQELVGLIRTRPVRKDGQIKGYKLFPGKDRALFNRLGLRPGDVIISVNGMDLSDPANGLALLGQLSSASEVTVELERRGERQTVTLSLE